jgi:hypothetical protein
VVAPDRLLALLTDKDDPVVRGAVLCRAGRQDEALTLLGQRADAVALLYRGLAELGRGRPDAARSTLEQAEQWLRATEADDPGPSNLERLTWQQRLEVEQLRGELGSLLRARDRLP